MNNLPQHSQVIAEALDHLLSDVESYSINIKGLKWTPGLRHFPKLQQMLEPLHQATQMGTEMLANRMIDLGAQPLPSDTMLSQRTDKAMPVQSFAEATWQVIEDSQVLLQSIRETFDVAATYDDQPTMRIFMQAAHYIQNTIWSFSALRSAQLN
jgi:DNA-binding ferritin-like protein